MKTLSSLNLKFPSLGLKEMRRSRGGWTDPYTGIMYDDSEHGNQGGDTHSGGELPPCYCYAWWNAPYNSARYAAFAMLSSMGNYSSDGKSSSGGSSAGGDSGSGYYYNSPYFDSNFSSDEQYSIKQLVASLPKELQKNLAFALDDDITDPRFCHAGLKGYEDSNGQWADHLFNYDTLVFKNFDQIKDNLWEEAFHQWQYHYYNFDSDSVISHQELLIMELQTDIVEFLRLRVLAVPLTSLGNDLNFVVDMHKFFGDENSDRYVDFNRTGPQIGDIISRLTKDDWKSIYNSWKTTSSYQSYSENGRYDIDIAALYNIPWSLAISMWFPTGSSSQMPVSSSSY